MRFIFVFIDLYLIYAGNAYMIIAFLIHVLTSFSLFVCCSVYNGVMWVRFVPS